MIKATREVLASAEISRQILEKMASGLNVRDAMKAVCGAEAVERMIDDLYHELRSRAGK